MGTVDQSKKQPPKRNAPRAFLSYVNMVFYYSDIFFEYECSLDDAVVLVLLSFKLFKAINNERTGFALRN